MGTTDVADVICSTLYSFRSFKAFISTTVSSSTRPSGEQPRKGNLGLTHSPQRRTFTLKALSYFSMAFASLAKPYLIQYVWKGSASIFQILLQINLNASKATFGWDCKIILPILKAERHSEAVTLYHLSLNHFSDRLCCSVPSISPQDSGVMFFKNTVTFSDNNLLCSSVRS